MAVICLCTKLLHVFKSVVCLYGNLRKNNANDSFLRRISAFSVEYYQFLLFATKLSLPKQIGNMVHQQHSKQIHCHADAHLQL